MTDVRERMKMHMMPVTVGTLPEMPKSCCPWYGSSEHSEIIRTQEKKNTLPVQKYSSKLKRTPDHTSAKTNGMKLKTKGKILFLIQAINCCGMQLLKMILRHSGWFQKELIATSMPQIQLHSCSRSISSTWAQKSNFLVLCCCHLGIHLQHCQKQHMNSDEQRRTWYRKRTAQI